jgi:hypothetical protein
LAGGYSFLEPAPSKCIDEFVVRSIPHNEDGQCALLYLFGLDGVRLLSKILPRAIFRKIFEAQRSAWLRSQYPRSHNDKGERGETGNEASHRPQYKAPSRIHRRCPLQIQYTCFKAYLVTAIVPI